MVNKVERLKWRRITRHDPIHLAVCRFIPPPLGLPQRSGGLATRNAALPPPFAFFSSFPPPITGRRCLPRTGRRKRRKKRRTAFEGRPVVVNPSLRRGKPGGGGRRLATKTTDRLLDAVAQDLCLTTWVETHGYHRGVATRRTEPTAMNTSSESPSSPPPAASLPPRALIILVLGLLSAWLSAGSLGWPAPPLQKALTWLSLTTIVVIAFPDRRRMYFSDWLLLGGAAVIAVLMTASSLSVVNVLAVAVLLAAIARVRPGPTSQVAGPVALAAAVLAIFRLVCDSSAAAWTFTNSVGGCEGLWAGWLTGRPLLIGASFGGIDFLAVMTALAAAWLIAASRPRLVRALYVVLAILIAQTAYLVALAFSHDLTRCCRRKSFLRIAISPTWAPGLGAIRSALCCPGICRCSPPSSTPRWPSACFA